MSAQRGGCLPRECLTRGVPGGVARGGLPAGGVCRIGLLIASIGGLEGGTRDASHRDPNSFIFMQFLAKI